MELTLIFDKTYFIKLRNAENLRLEQAVTIANQKFNLINQIDKERADYFGLDVNSDDVEILSFSKINDLKKQKLDQLYQLTNSTIQKTKLKYSNLQIEDTLSVVAEVFLRKKNNGQTFRYDIEAYGVSLINIPASVASYGCTIIEEYRTNLRQFKKQYEEIINYCENVEQINSINFDPINILGVSFDAKKTLIIEITQTGDMALVNSKTGEPIPS